MKTNLLKRSTELRASLSGANQQVSDMQVKDSGDEAVSTSMDSLQSSLTQSEVEELNQIEAALARIERDEFGICIDCGEKIIEKRLIHFPFAARCIICQEEVEQARQ
jgi:DnaK suppressor protein